MDGIFKKVCREAESRPGDKFVVIIDEINRGNLSRIFGELLLTLEYRTDNTAVVLPYSGEPFSIPTNVYLIGTMNTTDRSLALIDYALRRRFYFHRLMPVDGGQAKFLDRWLRKQSGMSEANRQRVLRLFVALNQKVQDELGEHFQVGHSYFMTMNSGTDSELDRIWRHAITPLLEEYFHNHRERTDFLKQFGWRTLLRPGQGPAEPITGPEEGSDDVADDDGSPDG
jgi:5-methylcytosine-specific restriction protein B